MNINTYKTKKNNFPRSILLIILLSLLPVYYTWGKVLIGGDTNIPYSSQAILKYLYQWVDVQNGVYFSVNLLPLYFFYKIAELIGLGYYGTSSMLLFCLNLVAGIGIYKLASIFYRGKNQNSFFVPVLFYLLSPSYLNAWHYLYIYSFAPWFLYFVAKFVKTMEAKLADVIWVNLVIFFASQDLPNPKYIFYLILSGAIYIILSYIFKLIDGSFLLKVFLVLILSTLLSSYLLLPLFGFVRNYAPTEYGVSVNPGGATSDNMMDSGTATMNKMFRLHHNGININKEESQFYLSNPLIIFLGYVFISLILLDVIRNRKNSKQEKVYRLIFFFLIILFLALATGPNPPFGVIYRYVVFSFPPLAFLRTTAGAVFILSILYSIYLFLIVQSEDKNTKLVQTAILCAILVIGYPVILGDIYELNNKTNQFVEKSQHGFRLPVEYFEVQRIIDNQRVNSRVFFPGSDPSYISTSWGYFGPLIYSFMFEKSPISTQSITFSPKYHSAGVTVIDKSLISKEVVATPEGDLVFSKGLLEVYENFNSNFLPIVYVPQKIYTFKSGTIGFDLNLIKESSISSAILSNKDLVEDPGASSPPVMEYKKINPTKYIVLVHKAKSDFLLVLSEKYNKGWEVFKLSSKYRGRDVALDFEEDVLNNYNILPDNQHTQATKQELLGYIQNGYISSLGGEAENQKSSIDFVSRNFHNTIQNDNLPSGVFFENWNKKPMFKESHRMVNGYSNLWKINIAEACTATDTCKQNKDGSFDIELIIEFYPQRYFYYGLTISLVTFSGLLGVILFYKKRKL